MSPDPTAVMVALLLTPPGLVVFGRMLFRIRERGGRVETGVFGLPDLIMGFFLTGFFALASLFAPSGEISDGTARTLSAEDAISGAIFSLIFVGLIFGFLKYRRISLAQVFGIMRVPPWRAALIGPLLILAALPALTLVILLTQGLMHENAKEQDVVTMFREAARSNETSGIIAMFFMAAVVAPLFEEIVFRGYLYPVFKKWAGILPSAVFTAALFAVIHNSLVVTPSLLLLAIAFTIAYEWSGSILVPVAMHASFNAAQLSMLLAAASAAP